MMADFSVSTRQVMVVRVVTHTVTVDDNYARVEFVIDGETYEFSRPDAQVLGAALNNAAGGVL